MTGLGSAKSEVIGTGLQTIVIAIEASLRPTCVNLGTIRVITGNGH